VRIAGLVLGVLLAATLAAQAPRPADLGPAVGIAAPTFSGVDQFGRHQTLQSLTQRDGLMLVFFRSADW
jgi:hypothetical protein